MGHFDAGGSFVRPISFFEALSMPKSEIDTYLELDNLLAIMKRREDKKGQKK